jgi:hypothetical protein
LRKKSVRRRPDASEPDAAGVLRPPVDLGLGAGLWRGRTAEGGEGRGERRAGRRRSRGGGLPAMPGGGFVAAGVVA